MTTLIEEAKALLAVAEVLDGLPDDEARCRVMAMAALQGGDYEHAIAFAERAQEIAHRRELDKRGP